MRLIYHLMVLYLTAHLLWYLFREKKFWMRISTALVLVMFLLRLLLVK
jgi:hypothetical protein